MESMWITRHGGPEVLEMRHAPDPTCGSSQVRLQVKATGLNFADIAARHGLYPDAPKPPCVVGYEAAGVLEQVGSDVSQDWREGMAAVAVSHFGAHASRVCVPASQLLPLPKGMSFDEGAAIPVNFITAYELAFRAGAVRDGDTVLVHMAAGGVGLAALQLCKLRGAARVFGTASSSKHSFLRQAGCDEPIDYHEQDYAEVVRELTDGKGVDVVFDPLGGSSWRRGYDLLRPGGRLVAYGFANMIKGGRRSLWNVARQMSRVPRFSPMRLMDDNRGVHGVNIGHLWSETGRLTGAMRELMSHFEEGRLRVHLDRQYPLSQMAEAQTRMESRLNIGKITLNP